MKSLDKAIEECNAQIPRSVIQSREGGFGKQLDYLPGFYVINHLNEVFGQGNWAYGSETSVIHTGTYTKSNGKEFQSAHYTAKVRLVVTFPDGKSTEFTDYGYGDGTDPQNIGKAHELAIKEAVTDGLKRAARNLGNSFGNGLYDRSGAGIDEGDAPASARPNPSPALSGEGPSRTTSGNGQLAGVTLKLIAANGRVALDKKLLTEDRLVAMVKEYGVSRKEDLSEEQGKDLIKKLEAILNG